MPADRAPHVLRSCRCTSACHTVANGNRRPGRRGARPRGPLGATARGRPAWRGAAARHRGGGHGQDHRPHPAHRPPHLVQAGAARGGPGPHLHRESGGGDGREGRPAHPVRLRRDVDRHLPRLRRPDSPRVGARGRARPRVPRPHAAGADHLPARAAMAIAAEALPSPRRPHAAPGRAARPGEPGQGRGHRALRLQGMGFGAPRDGAGPGRPRRRGAARRAGRVLRSLPAAPRRGGRGGLRRPDLPRPGAAARASGRAGRAARTPPVRAGRRVPGHQPRPARDDPAPGRTRPPQRHRRRRRRPGDLPLARRGGGEPARVPRPI